MLMSSRTPRRSFRAGALLLAAAVTLGLPAAAGAAVSADVMAAAKREGLVVWYTSVDAKTLPGVVTRFEQTHPGIKLQTLQITSNLIPARILTEQRGHQYNADVCNGDIVPMSQLAAAGVLQPYHPAEPGKFVKGAIDPNGLWTSLYDDTTVLAWNPKKLAADGLKPPTSLADLTKPEWSGKIGIDSTAYNWYQGLVETDPKAQEFLKKLVANKPFLTQGHTNTVTQLEAGEFDVTPTAYGYMADLEHRNGRPVDFLNPKPLFVGLGPVGFVANAPHPNAARVFLDWLLSKDGQQTIIDVSGRPSARTDVQNNANVFNARMPIHILSTPDQAKYKDLVSEYKALLGISN
jgi:iron(III) transport system substrate-binding protein